MIEVICLMDLADGYPMVTKEYMVIMIEVILVGPSSKGLNHWSEVKIGVNQLDGRNPLTLP